MHRTNGSAFPIPAPVGEEVVSVDESHTPLAVIQVEEAYRRDPREVELVFDLCVSFCQLLGFSLPGMVQFEDVCGRVDAWCACRSVTDGSRERGRTRGKPVAEAAGNTKDRRRGTARVPSDGDGA